MNGRGARKDSKNGFPEAEKIEVYLNQPERRSCSCSSSFRYPLIISSSVGLRTKAKIFPELLCFPLQWIFYAICGQILNKKACLGNWSCYLCYNIFLNIFLLLGTIPTLETLTPTAPWNDDTLGPVDTSLSAVPLTQENFNLLKARINSLEQQMKNQEKESKQLLELKEKESTKDGRLYFILLKTC